MFRREHGRGRDSDTVAHAFLVLREPLQPKHRHQRYEDRLSRAFRRGAPGSAVVGGGTELGADGEPTSAEIEVRLVANTDVNVDLVVSTLEARGAPSGSELRIDGRPAVAFGRTLGVGLYLNGVDLDDEVYATSDVNVLIKDLERSTKPIGAELHSWWEGPRETAVYFYGHDRNQLRDRIATSSARHRLADRSRLVDF